MKSFARFTPIPLSAYTHKVEFNKVGRGQLCILPAASGRYAGVRVGPCLALLLQGNFRGRFCTVRPNVVVATLECIEA